MESIKLAVNGNYISIIEKPKRITAGTVGLPVEFEFDRAWDGLSKTAVFHVGCKQMMADIIDNMAIVPWEILQHPSLRLNIGVYGASVDGAVAIVSTWSTVGDIHQGANPHNDPLANPAIPIWQKILHAIGVMPGLKTETKNNLVGAINEVYDKVENESTNIEGMAEHLAQVKKTTFAIPPNSVASIAFFDEVTAMIYCIGWGGSLSALFYYSGYATGTDRQSINTLVNEGQVSCGLNVESAGQGISIKNNHPTAELHVCIDSGALDRLPTISFTDSNAAELYTEYSTHPPGLNYEYRTRERWNGQVVYTKLFDFGTLPKATSKTVPHNAVATRIIRCEGSCSNGETIYASADLTGVTIKTETDKSSLTAIVQVWYIKN